MDDLWQYPANRQGILPTSPEAVKRKNTAEACAGSQTCPSDMRAINGGWNDLNLSKNRVYTQNPLTRTPPEIPSGGEVSNIGRAHYMPKK